MDSRDPRGHGSASDQQSDSLFEALVAEAAALRRHATMGSDASPRAVMARMKCVRDALTFKKRQVRLQQSAGLLLRLRRRARSNTR